MTKLFSFQVINSRPRIFAYCQVNIHFYPYHYIFLSTGSLINASLNNSPETFKRCFKVLLSGLIATEETYFSFQNITK